MNVLRFHEVDQLPNPPQPLDAYCRDKEIVVYYENEWKTYSSIPEFYINNFVFVDGNLIERWIKFIQIRFFYFGSVTEEIQEIFKRIDDILCHMEYAYESDLHNRLVNALIDISFSKDIKISFAINLNAHSISIFKL